MAAAGAAPHLFGPCRCGNTSSPAALARRTITNRNATGSAEPGVAPEAPRPAAPFLEQCPVGLVHTDPQGVILYENARFRLLTGRGERDSWVGTHLDQMDPRFVEQLRQVGDASGPALLRATLARAGASPRHFRVDAAPVTEEGRLLGYTLTFRLAGDAEELEEELRTRRLFDSVEPLLRNAALSLPSEPAFLDDVARLLGTAVNADQVYILLSAEDADAYEEEVRWAREPERSLIPLRLELSGTTIERDLSRGVAHLLSENPNGSEHEALAALGAREALAVRFLTAAERPGVLLLTRARGPGAWSTTERAAVARLGALVETLLAWMRAEQRYRGAIAAIDDCLLAFTFDEGGERRLSLVTHQVERLTGSSANELLEGRRSWVHDVVHEADRPALRAVERGVRAGEAARLVYRVTHPDGSARWIRESLSPQADAAGRLTVASMLSDVTDQKQAEAELVQARQDAEAAERLKAAFLATMSHEIRTPLGVIKGFSDLLREELADHPALSGNIGEFLDAIHVNAARVLKLVQHLLELSHLQTGRLPLEAAPIAAAPLVADVASRFRDDLAARGIALHVDAAADDAVALGDHGRVDQVLEVVLSNASKFTEQGAIRVEVTTLEAAVQVRISDTGVGIASESMPQLFTPFFQEDNSLNRAFEGSGLGLALARRLMEAMHGAISIESRKGEGTEVTLTLPRADA